MTRLPFSHLLKQDELQEWECFWIEEAMYWASLSLNLIDILYRDSRIYLIRSEKKLRNFKKLGTESLKKIPEYTSNWPKFVSRIQYTRIPN